MHLGFLQCVPKSVVDVNDLVVLLKSLQTTLLGVPNEIFESRIPEGREHLKEIKPVRRSFFVRVGEIRPKFGVSSELGPDNFHGKFLDSRQCPIQCHFVRLQEFFLTLQHLDNVRPRDQLPRREMVSNL